MSLRSKLYEILNKVQAGSTQIYLRKLQNLYNESDFEEFLKEFLKCVDITLKTKYEQDHYREKLLVFFSKFCTSLKKPSTDETETDLCPFLREVLLHLFKEYNPDTISPYRVCQLIKLLLKEIGDQESLLDEDICIQIRDLMLERIDDVKAKVRIQSIEVLQRLQDPLDNNDIIIKAFIERLNDENSQVRKYIVHCIGLNIVSIPAVIGRCLDVSDEVRFVSYDKLSKIPIKALKIAQRQFILRNGFKSKNPKIRNFVVKTLLTQWLETYTGDYIQLIRALKLDADEDDFKETIKLVEQVLEELFKNTEISTIMEALPLTKEKLISSGQVQWEEILFWRCLEQFLRTQETEDDYVDKILPELIFFCDFVSRVYKSKCHVKNDWEMIQHDHIMLELLKICHDYDLADEVGRTGFQNLIINMLIDGPALYEATELLVKLLEKLLPDIDERATKICEIIAEIQTPLATVAPSEDMIRKQNVKLAEFRCKLNIAEDKQETAIEKEDYKKAAELKKEIAAIKEKIVKISKEFDEGQKQRLPKTDSSTLCRCLDVMTAALQNSKIKTLPEPFHVLQVIFLPLLLNSKQADVFCRALKQLCLFAYYDEKLAKESMKIFFAPLLAHRFRPVYGDQTTITAITCVTDMLLVHGSAIFEEEDVSSSQSLKPINKRRILDRTAIDETICNEPPPPSLELVIEILSELLDDADDKIKETSGECLITLILTGRVRSPTIFSKLLLKWFSPSTQKDVRLRQMISRLFTDYVPESPYSLETIEQAFVPTLVAIIEAPRSSPLADVDVDSVSKFLAALSQPGRHRHSVGLDAHKNIALNLCREICDRPNNKRTITYLKALLYLEPVTEDEVTLEILRKQVDSMQDLIKEKSALKYVYKYRHILDDDATHNDKATTATNLDSIVPESTNTTNVDSTTTQDIPNSESSRYPALSVKRRKRKSKEHGDQNHNGSVVACSSRNLENEENISRLIISETDSEYNTENETQRHKKQICTISDQELILPQNKNGEISVEPSENISRSVTEGPKQDSQTKNDRRHVLKELRVNLPRIGPICSNLAEKRNENEGLNSEKELKITLVQDPKIEQMCSELGKKSSKKSSQNSKKKKGNAKVRRSKRGRLSPPDSKVLKKVNKVPDGQRVLRPQKSLLDL